MIGAGPAGLSAAVELAARGRCLVVDGGGAASERDRDDTGDVLAGVGGAGLFSDGKHSFYPSASELWRLPDHEALEGAFRATATLLARWGIDAGPFRTTPVAARDGEKRYPSHYLGLAERMAVIGELARDAGEVRTRAWVRGVARDGDGFNVELDEPVRARSIVVATGRWSPTWMRWLEAVGVRFAFRRVEVGVRIELPAEHPLFARLPGVDGKVVWHEGDVEVRTFCTCRNGEVVLGRAGGIEAWSGRADVAPTGRSNVGVVARFREPPARDVERAVIARALETLVPDAPADMKVYEPCIEGVGDYPVDDGHLCIAPGVHVAGDACGRFRGIVAAMISGRYVARRILAA